MTWQSRMCLETGECESSHVHAHMHVLLCIYDRGSVYSGRASVIEIVRGDGAWPTAACCLLRVVPAMLTRMTLAVFIFSQGVAAQEEELFQTLDRVRRETTMPD